MLRCSCLSALCVRCADHGNSLAKVGCRAYIPNPADLMLQRSVQACLQCRPQGSCCWLAGACELCL